MKKEKEKEKEKKMAMRRRDFLKGSAAVLAGTAVSAGLGAGPLIRVSQASQGTHKMVLAHSFPDMPTLMDNGLFKFKEVVEKESNGKLIVELHGGDELGGQEKTPEKVRLGAIQACNLSPQNFSKFVEVLDVLDFPYLFKNMESYRKAMMHPELQKAFNAESEKRGFKILKFEPTGFRALGQGDKLKKGVRVPADCKGIKARVTASKIELQAFSLVGANPVPMAWGECYTGMQSGAIDTVHVGIAPLYVTKIHETFKYCTPINFMMNANMTVMNPKWYNDLPDPLKEAVQKGVKESWETQNKQQDINNALVAVKFLEQGINWIQPTKDEMQQWYEAIGHQRKEWDEWRKRLGAQLYETVVAVSEGKA